MRVALAAFRSASDRHFVRGRQSSCAVPHSWHRAARPNPLDLSALSVQHKQDHSFATRTKQRALVRLCGLHASCILVSKSDRNYTTLCTGFASAAPVRMDRTGTSTRKLFTSGISQHVVEQSPATCVGRRCLRRRSNRTNVPHNEIQALILQCLALDLDDHWDCRCFCTIRPVRTCQSSLLFLSTHSCWSHSCIVSATFSTASSFAFVASLSSGLVLGVQILGALRALFLIDFSSITSCFRASLGPRCSMLLPATSHSSQPRV